MNTPLWLRAMRWYALHSPLQRGSYRLALWLYQRLPVPDIEVEASLDRTLSISLRLRIWVDYNIYCLGFYEAPLARFFLRALEPDSVILDVGAYIGQYTLLAAKYASAGQVIAFEPHPESRQRLSANVARNRLPNVTIIPGAAGESAGRMQFALSEDGFSSGLRLTNGRGSSSIEVDVTALDKVAQEANLPRVDVIKIDVEGAEGLVLRGARRVLARFRPLLIVEINRQGEQMFGDTPEKILGQLRKLGYTPHALRRDRLLPLADRAVNYENVIAIPPPTNRAGGDTSR